MVSLKEVMPLTGHLRGGVTILGSKKQFPVFVDFTIDLREAISISAGRRGVQLILAPADYLRAVRGVVGKLGGERVDY